MQAAMRRMQAESDALRAECTEHEQELERHQRRILQLTAASAQSVASIYADEPDDKPEERPTTEAWRDVPIPSTAGTTPLPGTPNIGALEPLDPVTGAADSAL